jgi:hypothetical protein
MRTLRQATPSGVISVVRLLARLGFRQSRIAIGATLAFLVAGPAFSQQQAVVAPGQAVVTGFSGFVAYPPPANADPFDYVTLNTLGPSARVVDLTNPGPQGVLSPAPKPLTINAAQVGQVFGVALDNAPQPNIYLGATSLYGLSIFRPDPQGLLKRQRQGAPGAQFVPGQFGPPELGGSSGSIWRVSGTTGEVSLFSAVGIGSPASLGGLAFHAGTQQIFATDRATGIVYRLSLDGLIKGTYDHGIEGRPGAGLAPLPLGPVAPVNINGPQFSTDNPATWGFAPPARRVFALAVHNDRLYYSIAQGPQIWSAGIRPTGSIPGSDARLEVEVPSLADGVEITSIAFDAQGRMYLAERGRTTGDYYMYHVASAGQSRVLRYVPKAPGDPAPGRWRLQPDQYSVGLAPFYNNADGGVALNYGYTPAGALNPGACGANVWMTGERLMDPGNAQAGTFETVDGLQGNAASVFQPQNMPPSAAWFVDYNDQPGNENYRGHMGDIATIPCPVAAPPAPPPVPPPPPPVSCPPGTYFSNGQCLIYPTCPPGTTFLNGQCVYPQCPPGFVMHGNQCVPPPQICPPGHVFYQGQCVPLACPPGLIRLPNGLCSCPANTIYVNGQCVPPNQCPPGAINLGGICFCPGGLFMQGNQCQPFSCPAGQVLDIVQGKCIPITCPPGQELKQGQCKPITCPPNQDLFNNKCVPKCGPNQVHTMPDGVCAPLLCGFPTVPFNGKCVQPCLAGFQHTMPDGVCKPMVIQPPVQILCIAPKEMVNGQCVDPCPANTTRQPDGTCKPNLIIQPPVQILCIAPQEMVNGQCVDPCPANTTRQPDGTCKPNLIIQPPVQILCIAPQEMVNGQCVDPCPALTTRQPDGTCKPNLVIQPPLQILCIAPQEMVNGQCVDPCPPLTTRQPDGTCKPNLVIQPPLQILCIAPQEMVNGQCVDPCPPLTTRQPDGTCKPNLVIQPPLQILARAVPLVLVVPVQEHAGPAVAPIREARTAGSQVGIVAATASADVAVARVPETISPSTSCSLVFLIYRSPTFSPRFSTMTRSPTCEDVLQAVRNDDLCDAVLLEFEHRLEQPLGRHDREVGRRLVEDDDARLERDCAGDRDRLLAAAGQAFDALIDRVHVDLEALQHLVGLGIHLLAVDEDAPPRPAAEEDVLADVHVPAERKVLIDHLDADIAALVRAAEMDGSRPATRMSPESRW